MADRDDDRALAEFRGFEHIAQAYALVIKDADVLQKLEDIVTTIQNALQHRKKVLRSK